MKKSVFVFLLLLSVQAQAQIPQWYNCGIMNYTPGLMLKSVESLEDGNYLFFSAPTRTVEIRYTYQIYYPQGDSLSGVRDFTAFNKRVDHPIYYMPPLLAGNKYYAVACDYYGGQCIKEYDPYTNEFKYYDKPDIEAKDSLWGWLIPENNRWLLGIKNLYEVDANFTVLHTIPKDFPKSMEKMWIDDARVKNGKLYLLHKQSEDVNYSTQKVAYAVSVIDVQTGKLLELEQVSQTGLGYFFNVLWTENKDGYSLSFIYGSEEQVMEGVTTMDYASTGWKYTKRDFPSDKTSRFATFKDGSADGRMPKCTFGEFEQDAGGKTYLLFKVIGEDKSFKTKGMPKSGVMVFSPSMELEDVFVIDEFVKEPMGYGLEKVNGSVLLVYMAAGETSIGDYVGVCNLTRKTEVVTIPFNAKGESWDRGLHFVMQTLAQESE